MSQNATKKRSGTVLLLATRNIGIFAHVDAGKTTTTERVLFYTNSKHKIGNVDEQDTTTDFMEQEKERGITIQSAAVSCSWKDVVINLIDTPGHVDFTMEVERSMRVLDGGVLVLCAKGGVQPQTRTVWRQAEKHRVPRIVFVNKMDTLGADFYRVLSQIKSELKAKPAVLQLPIGQSSEFVGVVDLLSMKALVWDSSDPSGMTIKEQEIPSHLADEATEYRKALIELIAEGDDSLLEKYLSDEPISEAELKAALRKDVIAMRLVPVMCGSAFKNKGIQPLLDAVAELLPSPLDVPPVTGVLEDGTEASRETDDSAPLAALAFKVMSNNVGNAVHGHLTFVRVYSGVLNSGSQVYNSNKDTRERVSRLVKMQGNRQEEVTALHAGEIGAVIGLKSTTTGDTLCDDDNSIKLESISAPEPVISQAIEPKDRAGADKLADALSKLALEDPSFRRNTDPETGQTIISGQGELHLEIKVDILDRSYGIKVSTGKPEVSYRETVRGKARGIGKHIKQSGGHGQYGHAEIELEPLPPGSGFEFVDAIVGGTVPREYISSVEKGIHSALAEGVLAGYPVVDVRATLVFGSSHDVDSSDMAFQMAGRLAFQDACRKAQPVLLEPVMELVVEVPESYMGDIIGDISSRRGKVLGFDTADGTTIVRANVPLATVFGYSTVLRGRTKGQGVFTLTFSHYEPVPQSVGEEIVSKRKS
ncbi:MAG TPA: elongation factor G [Candidatus Obscuribacterales bacterium]